MIGIIKSGPYAGQLFHSPLREVDYYQTSTSGWQTVIVMDESGEAVRDIRVSDLSLGHEKPTYRLWQLA